MDRLDDNPTAQKFVPVCAIGASAGGVTALQNLFRLLPADLGLAYVVILHLNPDEPSALSEILSACTHMPVHQVQDGPLLEPNCVYVIPPDRELVIDGNNVAARPFTEPRSQRATIDMFFRSAAAGRGDGVAIILSGAGSDGALGVSAVKEAGGVVMVQEPAEAGFAQMPQSAIATGMADFVGPIARLAEYLVEVAHSKEAVRSLDVDGAANDLRRIIALLRGRTGHDFSAYKRATVMRRVMRRMTVCRTVTFADYANHLRTNPEEAQSLFSDLLISVTMFFRDEAAFEALAHQAIKPVVETVTIEGNKSIRVWVVGCATGEEAYSIAILLHEELARQKATIPFQIFATDLDESALVTAREGRYPRTIEADVSEERLRRFFVDEGTHFHTRKELRERVLFAKHSILKEPPFIRLDLITCRNLLIYFERTMQAQVCSIFHYGLRPGRYLFLGSAETIDAASDLFAPIDRQARIYSSRPHAGHPLPVLPQFAVPEQIARSARPAPARTEMSVLPAVLHVAALENNAPASALVDDGQNILHLSPTAGRFILHSAGPVSNALPTMVRPELRLDLRLALTRALEWGEHTITLPTIVAFEQGWRRVAMHIVPVASEAQRAPQALVFFLDGSEVRDGEASEALREANADDVRRLYAELKASQEALIVSRSGHDAAIQELRAANEELQSTNEEYRSTAEELETSKEELQSINEELHTINAELKSKLETISSAHSDLQNLTAATEIGTLFLDPELRIRMFTPPVAELFNVIRKDVGRAITDLTHNLDYDGIEEDAAKVLRDLVPIERQIGSRQGRSYLMRLRPYRTVEDRIDGTVVTFVDVSERARAEAALRKSEMRYRTLFESMDEAYAVIEVLKDEAGAWSDFRFIEVNPALLTHTSMPWPVGKTATELLGTPNPRWTELYGQALDTNAPIRVEEDEPTLGRTFDLNIFTLDRDRNRVAVLFTNITARKQAEEKLRASEARFQALFAASPVPFIVLNSNPLDFTITAANDAFLAVAMTTREQLVGRRMFDAFTDDPTRPDAYGPVLLEASLHRVLATRGTDVMPRLRYDPQMPDGGFEPNWWLPVNAPILDASGEVTAIIHQATKVTELHLAEEAERTRQAQQAFLLDLSDALRPLTDPADVQTVAMRMLAERLGVMRASFFEIEKDDDTFRLTARYERDAPPLPERMRLSEFSPTLGDAFRAGRTLAVADTEITGELVAEPEAYRAVGVGAWAAVPLLRNRRLAAWIGVHARTRREWSAADLKALDDVAERTWGAVERAHAEAALRRNEGWLAAQKEAFQVAMNGGSLEASLGVLTAAVVSQTADGRRCGFYIANATGAALTHVVGMPPAYAEAMNGFEISLESLACGLAVATGRPVTTRDVLDEPRWAPWTWMAREFDFRGCWSFPLETAMGELVGSFAMYFREPWDAEPEDIEYAATVAHTAAIIISRHNENEQRIRSEEHYRLIVGSAKEYAIITLDMAGIIVSWNTGAERMLGYTETEIIGQPASVFFLLEDRAAGKPELEMRRAREEGRAENERWHVRKDGSKFWGSGLTMPLTNGHQRGYVTIFQDRSAEREAKQRLEQAAIALQTGEQRLRLAIEAGQIGIFDWDLRTGDLHWDDRLRALWAVPADAQDLTIDIFYAGLHPDDIPRLGEEIATALDPTGSGAFNAEYRVIGLAGGPERCIAARGQTRFEDGQAIRMYGTGVDVTPLRQAESILARSKAELEQLVAERTRELETTQARLAHAQRMEALGQLAGGIAHDFNNVLQGVQGAIRLIESRPTEVERVRRLASLAVESLDRGASVTRRLLAFSRLGDLRTEPMDAPALLSGLQEILSHTLGATIEVRVLAPPKLPSLLADKAQLETVLINLATNSRDAMASGGILTFSAAIDQIGPETSSAPPLSPQVGDYVKISVSDTGTGMPPEVLARASEPFFTTKDVGKGTGLGLAMARGFAEQSGGRLAIESTPGEGTTVSLWFPVTAEAQRAASAFPDNRAGTPVVSGEARARVLLVDDDAIVRETLAQEMEAEGYIILPASSGAEALALLESGEAVDLLISDLSMPGMDGITVIREAQRRRPSLVAILLTGYAMTAAGVGLGGAMAGILTVLRKPINGRVLAERVAVLLEGRPPARGGGGA